MDRLGGRLMEFLSSLGDSFFMVSLSVSLADLVEQSLFHTFEGNSFQCMDNKQLWSEKDNVVIISSSRTMICSPGQCIRLPHGLARPVVQQEVEASKVE
jgi:hypothetical protein